MFLTVFYIFSFVIHILNKKKLRKPLEENFKRKEYSCVPCSPDKFLKHSESQGLLASQGS